MSWSVCFAPCMLQARITVRPFHQCFFVMDTSGKHILSKDKSPSVSECCDRCGSQLTKSAVLSLPQSATAILPDGSSGPSLTAATPALELGGRAKNATFPGLMENTEASGMQQQSMQHLADAIESTNSSEIPQQLQMQLQMNGLTQMKVQLPMQAQAGQQLHEFAAATQQTRSQEGASNARLAPSLATSMTLNEKSSHLLAVADSETDHHAPTVTAGRAFNTTDKHCAKQCQSCNWKVCSACCSRAALRQAAFEAKPQAGPLRSVQRETMDVPFFFPVSICVLNAGTAAEARGGDVCQLGVVAWNQPTVRDQELIASSNLHFVDFVFRAVRLTRVFAAERSPTQSR